MARLVKLTARHFRDATAGCMCFVVVGLCVFSNSVDMLSVYGAISSRDDDDGSVQVSYCAVWCVVVSSNRS